MKKLDTMQEGGYPFDDVSIAYLQKMHDDRDDFIVSVFGDNTIVKGAEFDVQANLVSDGLITVGGKLYHFVGGVPNGTISKKVIETKRYYEDGNEKKAFLNEFYEFGEGDDSINFSDLKRIKNLQELAQDETLVNTPPTWDEIKDKPTFLAKKIFGTITVGDLDGETRNLTVSGNLVSAAILSDSSTNDVRIQVNFPTVGTTNYVPIAQVVSMSSNFNNDNDIVLSVKNKTSTSLQILLRDTAANPNNINVEIQIVV